MADDATVVQEPLLPVRGLVPVQNAKGKPYAIRDVHRWMRLNRVVYKVEKLDLLVNGPITPDVVSLFCYGRDEGILQPVFLPLSIRTDCPTPPDTLAQMKTWGLLDVFLCPGAVDCPNLDAWFELCRREDVPMRLQVQPPFPDDFDPERFAARAAGAGVSAVNVVLNDPFRKAERCRTAEHSRATVGQMNALVASLDGKGVEANLYGLPLCLVRNENRDRAGSTQRFFLDHQQYHKRSYEVAVALFKRRPALAGIAVAALLGRGASFRGPADEFLLKWLIMYNHHRLHERFVVISKLAKAFRLMRGNPKERVRPDEAYATEVAKLGAHVSERLAPECVPCSLRRVCDHAPRKFRTLLPGLKIITQGGDLAFSPGSSLRRQRKHFDVIDKTRRDRESTEREMAREAREVMLSSPPDTTYGFDDIRPVNAYSMRMPGARRYLALTSRELVSTNMFYGEPPFTASVTFGGGIADYIGFSIWDTIKIVCPMEDFSHQVALHVAADGRYVLLRDGTPVRPVEFENHYYAPVRLPSLIKLQVSIWNVDGAICTQNPLVWQGKPDAASERQRVRYTALVVSTRFARRLQAVIQSIAHQEGIDPGAIEVIVGYVPGIDATDDVITSCRLAYPGLRIVRSPFPESNINSKGVIINRSVEMASGEWIVILDSDIIVAPSMFARLGEVDESCVLAAPMGRKMLTRDVTAGILMGEVQPWREWQALLDGPGDARFGEKREGGLVPVGFCQCVRKTCFEKVKYNEYDHFEAADYEFANAIVERYGPCVWLDVPVLHLDHGGSQWYGTRVQR